MIRAIFICALLFSYISSNASWLEDRFRGWYFLEESPKTTKEETLLYDTERREVKDPDIARKFIQERQKRLDDKRDLMIANPTEEKYLLEYLREEDEYQKLLEQLRQTHAKASFSNPQFFQSGIDNQYAVKYEREKIESEHIKAVAKFAREFDLYIVASGSCPACNAFLPIFKGFVDRFRIKASMISVDDYQDDKLPTVKNRSIAETLGVDSIPAVIAIKKNGQDAVIISVGIKTQQQLIENINILMNEAYK